jgi:hypothetical protein
MNLLPDVITSTRAIASRIPADLSADELAAVLDAGEILESYLKQARAEAERRLEKSDEIPGWELVPGRGRSSVVDTAAAFRALAPLLTERAFLDCCSTALGKLTEAVRAAEGVTEDEAKDILGEYLKGNIMKTPGTPTLSRAARQIELTVLPKDPEAA